MKKPIPKSASNFFYVPMITLTAGGLLDMLAETNDDEDLVHIGIDGKQYEITNVNEIEDVLPGKNVDDVIDASKWLKVEARYNKNNNIKGLSEPSTEYSEEVAAECLSEF